MKSERQLFRLQHPFSLRNSLSHLQSNLLTKTLPKKHKESTYHSNKSISDWDHHGSQSAGRWTRVHKRRSHVSENSRHKVNCRANTNLNSDKPKPSSAYQPSVAIRPIGESMFPGEDLSSNIWTTEGTGQKASRPFMKHEQKQNEETKKTHQAKLSQSSMVSKQCLDAFPQSKILRSSPSTLRTCHEEQ